MDARRYRGEILYKLFNGRILLAQQAAVSLNVSNREFLFFLSRQMNGAYDLKKKKK
jgi:hypothetical protein